jgi:hypothetical protein
MIKSIYSHFRNTWLQPINEIIRFEMFASHVHHTYQNETNIKSTHHSTSSEQQSLSRHHHQTANKCEPLIQPEYQYVAESNSNIYWTCC